MRTAHLKLPQDSLFIPGWLVAIVGGHILLLLLLFMITAGPSTADSPRLTETDLPRAQGAPITEMPETLVRVLITERGGCAIERSWVVGGEFRAEFERLLTAERPGILVQAHAQAPWSAIRGVLRAARDAGARRIEIQVTNGRGGIGSVPLDVDAPLPRLDDDARAQDLTDHLR